MKRVKRLAEAAAGRSKAREDRPRCRIIAPEAFDLIAAAHNAFAPDACNIVSNAYIRIWIDTHLRAAALAGPPSPTPNLCPALHTKTTVAQAQHTGQDKF